MNLDLQWWAHVTSILTFMIAFVSAGIGIWEYLRYRRERSEKQERLESYLKREKEKRTGKGQRSLLNIVSKIGLIEDEILQISFRSKRIERRIDPSEKGFADRLLFEYVDGQA